MQCASHLGHSSPESCHCGSFFVILSGNGKVYVEYLVEAKNGGASRFCEKTTVIVRHSQSGMTLLSHTYIKRMMNASLYPS